MIDDSLDNTVYNVVTPTCKRDGNAFQEGLPAARACVARKIGFYVPVDEVSFVGNYAGRQRCYGLILNVSYEDPFIAEVQFLGEGISRMTSATFMMANTEWDWPDPVPRDDTKPSPIGGKHEDARDRARYVCERTVKNMICRGMSLKGAIFIILDGRGNNRRAIEEMLIKLGIPVEDRPTVITVELNPDVAFVQAMRFGRKRVRWSQGDFRMQNKQHEVCGVERTILLDGHDVLSEQEKGSTTLLYLDYCGGPNWHVKFKEVYDKLRLLQVIAITGAKRQPVYGRDCAALLARAAPDPTEFPLDHTYNHIRVLCNVHARPEDPQEHEALLKKLEDAKVAEAVARKKMKLAATVRRNAAAAIRARVNRDNARAAQRCVGAIVYIDPEQWRGNPGKDYVDVVREGGKLCFEVSRTYSTTKCAVRAIMSDGKKHRQEECWYLDVPTVWKLNTC